MSQDDWRIAEYEQSSEDYRHFTTVGWQSTLAVLALDALSLIPAQMLVFQAFGKSSDSAIRLVSLWGAFMILIILGVLTLLIAWTEAKWAFRSSRRIKRIKEIEHEKGLLRFRDEPWWLKARIGWTYVALLVIVGGFFIASAFALVLWQFIEAIIPWI